MFSASLVYYFLVLAWRFHLLGGLWRNTYGSDELVPFYCGTTLLFQRGALGNIFDGYAYDLSINRYMFLACPCHI